jgi:hypothetical protein
MAGRRLKDGGFDLRRIAWTAIVRQIDLIANERRSSGNDGLDEVWKEGEDKARGSREWRQHGRR